MCRPAREVACQNEILRELQRLLTPTAAALIPQL
jgi:hypothetical protein